MRIYKYLAILLVSLILVGGVSAASWYVDNAVSGGSNSGTSWSNAWNSFSSISWSSIQPGDTIYISGGSSGKTYTEKLSVGKNGAPGAPILITNGQDPGHDGLVTFTGNGIMVKARRYITISKMKFGTDSQIRISGSGGNAYDASSASKYIVVDDNEFYVTIQGGVFVQTSDNVIVRNSVMTTPTYDSSQTDGIYSQKNKDNIYENNYIVIYNQNTKGHDDGIQMFKDDSTIVRNNFIAQVNDKSGNAQGIYATVSYGVHKWYNNVVDLNNVQSNAFMFALHPELGGTGTIEMYGNIVYGTRPYHLFYVADADYPVVKNNIAVVSGVSLFPIEILGGKVNPSDIDYNLVYNPKTSKVIKVGGSSKTLAEAQALGYMINGIDADPKFVYVDDSGVNDDFRLQSSSPAISAGVNLGSPYNLDKDGNSRGSSWDIGAFEFGGSGCPPPPLCGVPPPNGCYYSYTVDSNGCEVCGGLVCSDSDTNGDGCVNIAEIVAYVEKWQNGLVTISQVVAGVEQWKQGC